MTWRTFTALWLASLAASASLVPVLVTVAAMRGTPTPWGATATLVMASAAVIYAAVVYVGLRIGARLDLGAPIVAGWAGGRVPGDSARRLGVGAAAGLGLGVVAILVAVIVAAGADVTDTASAEVLPLWAGVALSVFSAVDEELLFRFFVMTLIVWAIAKVMPPTRGGRPGDFGMWIAIGFAALIFEAAHVTPVGAGELALADSQPLRMVRGAVGLTLGWLFWKHGLESAVVMHFVYNMVFFYGVVLAV